MNTRDAILESALKIFVTRGFSASTSSITADAGVSTGLLFHYFPTKNDLIFTLYNQFYCEYHQDRRDIRRVIGDIKLVDYYNISKEIFFELVNWNLDNWVKFQFIQLIESSLLAAQLDIVNQKDVREQYEEGIRAFEIAIARGIYKELPAPFLYELVFMHINFYTIYLHNNPQYRFDDGFLRQSWDNVWCSISK